MNPSEYSDDNLRFRLREDLQFVDYSIRFGHQLVVKDPLRIEYFLFESFETSLLDLLKAPMSANELKRSADSKISPGKIDGTEIKSFLQRLLADNLIVVEKPGVGRSLWLARRQRRRRAWLQTILGILAIRFRGINPQSFLDFVNPVTRCLFHPLFLLLAALLFAGSVVTACLNANRIFESDYLWHNLGNPRTLIPIGLALMIVKILHELGHAFACRSINRDCHELGFMLLAFVPCLYCNVSDIWMEPNRWKRMLVSAAGIYVEMLIAVACLPLWLCSSSGAMQIFWFAMLTICSVNTLLINGNPLLRYDGYYLFSDWLGIPNLYSEAQNSIKTRLRSYFLKNSPAPEPLSFLDVYGVASKFYRVTVVCIIIYAVYAFFERMELKSLGTIVAAALVLLTFGVSTIMSFKKIRFDRISSALRIGRSLFLTVTLLLLLGFAASLPISPKTYADGEVTIQSSGIVYAPEDGTISWMDVEAAAVNQNQVIGKITSESLDTELIYQQQRANELELKLKNQKLLQSQGADNSREIVLLKNALASARKIESQLMNQVAGLMIHAPLGGILYSLPQTEGETTDILDLRRTTSSLYNENIGSFVQSGEPVAIVANPATYEVRLAVAEQQINRVAVGQNVKLVIYQLSPEILTGSVDHIAIDKTPLGNRQFDNDSNRDNDNIIVTVKLHKPEVNLLYKSKVKAAIIGDQVPLYKYLGKLITENFNSL